MYTYYDLDLVTMRGMSTNYDMELLMMTGMSTQARHTHGDFLLWRFA